MRFSLPCRLPALLACATIVYGANPLSAQTTAKTTPPAAASQPATSDAGAPLTAEPLPTDPKERLVALLRRNSLGEQGTEPLLPWHAKLSAQIFDHFGTHPQPATIEIWWASPERMMVDYSTAAYKATVTTNAQGTYRTTGKPPVPYLLSQIVEKILQPGTTSSRLEGHTVTEKTTKLGASKADCFTIGPSKQERAIPDHDDSHMLSPPTFCFLPDAGGLIASEQYTELSSARNKLGRFQNRFVPSAFSLAVSSVTVATAEIEQLSTFTIDDSLFVPSRQTLVPTIVTGRYIRNYRTAGDKARVSYDFNRL
jgi:hypothetical protein